MPRQSRIDAPGALQHVIVRGIERSAIFRDDCDREGFLARLSDILTSSQAACYAWVLMDNHVHLLLRPSAVSMATIMRRLLTGHAMAYNRRHKRHGYLFQNRYKSILCQEEGYFLALVRYIHLNPVRAGVVRKLVELDRYPFSGHSVILGNNEQTWQDITYVLGRFGEKRSEAIAKYRTFIREGLSDRHPKDLEGGGLIRSVGGWDEAKRLRREERIQSDERILGDSDFVYRSLAEAKERFDGRFVLSKAEIDLEYCIRRAADYFKVEPERLYGNQKTKIIVKARSVICFFAVHEVGMTTIEVSRELGLHHSTVCKAIERGRRLVQSMGISLLVEK